MKMFCLAAGLLTMSGCHINAHNVEEHRALTERQKAEIQVERKRAKMAAHTALAAIATVELAAAKENLKDKNEALGNILTKE